MESDALLHFSFTIQREKSFEILLDKGQEICSKLHAPIYRMEAKTWKLLSMENSGIEAVININWSDSDYAKVQKLIAGRQDLAHFLVILCT